MTRTEQDTWDLASSVGATATWVAAARALASKQPGALIDDPFAEAGLPIAPGNSLQSLQNSIAVNAVLQ